MRTLMKAILVAGAALAPMGAVDAAPARTEVGVLNCVVEGGTGLIITSRKRLTCTFDPTDGVAAVRETYVGEISKFGLDIGSTTGSVIAWLVLAPTTEYPPRALAGTYVGATGEATVGVGVGANLLVGGSNNTIALQPLSVQAQTGLNLALGAARLTLR